MRCLVFGRHQAWRQPRRHNSPLALSLYEFGYQSCPHLPWRGRQPCSPRLLTARH
ncbi:hypothetical protein [Moraxella lacunata]|uniref:hypothetical protein n=1 Tax=Moraxella lacunata TaxID=477 RepID=UPI003EE0933B